MTDQEFDRRVRELVERDGILEMEARARISLEAGENGDVEGAADPRATFEAMGDAWKPLTPPT
ncbi:MAG TPA: hypothetical protein VF624_18115 [Tepidisphaeraceae bacterium]|jgi:hypothetical protein